MRREVIGDATLILGDCREVLPGLDGQYEATIADPPYGLGDKWQGGKTKWKLNHTLGVEWDAETIPGFESLIDLNKPCIVWGGHLYNLPPARGWLIWDKIVRNFTSGHCEMAWTNLDQPIRAFSFSHGALATEGKFHPTQKPAALMAWCLSFIPGRGAVLDPTMGAGSTGVVCAQEGRPFIGIERDPVHFETALRRIEAAYAQPRLFDEPAPKPTQEALL